MNILTQIVDYKKTLIASAKINQPISSMNLTHIQPNFEQAITAKRQKNEVAIIAEIKKGSPSMGIIAQNCNIEEIANEYQNGGATCLSILTDEKFFFGTNQNIALAKKTSNLPILRKDFIIDEYQIYESKHLQASAILLIASILTPTQMQQFEEIATSLNLSVLVEVHTENELETALKFTKTPLIGINNRNLQTFKTNIQNTINLIKQIPTTKIPTCESGINSKDEISQMQKNGCNVFLIGTSIMKQHNKSSFIQSLIK